MNKPDSTAVNSHTLLGCNTTVRRNTFTDAWRNGDQGLKLEGILAAKFDECAGFHAVEEGGVWPLRHLAVMGCKNTMALSSGTQQVLNEVSCVFKVLPLRSL